MSSEDLEGNAKRILMYIQSNPGCHLRRIKSELAISMGTVQWHLNRLERARKIVSQRHGLRKHYFLLGAFGREERALLEVLSNEVVREILMLVGQQPSLSQTDIAKQVGISQPSVSWYMRRLVEFGVVNQISEAKSRRYKLHGDPKLIVAILRNYYPSVWDRWSSRLAEIFLALSTTEGRQAEDKKGSRNNV